MMTVITETTIRPGQEQRWDQAWERRVRDAPNQPGWIDVQLLVPPDDPSRRIVVGTWQNRKNWEDWHRTGTFQQTRDELNQVTASEGQPRWYEVRDRETMEA